MNHNTPQNILKVDAVTAQIGNARNKFLIIYNINVPFEYLFDEEDKRQVVERIKLLLNRDFLDYQVAYRITASYNIMHTNTGEQRPWTMSLQDDLKDFKKESFEKDSLNHLENIFDSLTETPDFSHDWIFITYNSVNFHVQAMVDKECPVLSNYPRSGRRAHRTFALPS